MIRSSDRAHAVWLGVLALAVQGCSSGSGGSQVGNKDNLVPIARPLVVNSGESNTVRQGAEVLLTGRDSEDLDGPLLDWKWTGPAEVPLVTRSRTTVSFTAPDVDAPTTYTFSLTVTDTAGATATTPIDVQVIPAGDLNRFLSPRGAQTVPSDVVTAVAALRPGTAVGPLDAPFTISLAATVTYWSRENRQETVEIDVADFAVPFAGHWPADETVECEAGQSDEQCMLASFVNSKFQFQVPRLDINDLNERFFASGELGRQLDPHMGEYAVVEVRATLDAGTLQDQAVLLLSGGGAVIAQTPASIIGTPATVTVPADELLGGLGGEEQRATAERYYRTVDPLYRRSTLSDWLQMAGFTDADGKLLPEAVAGEGEFAHAKYTNNFDLGFGRDMYARTQPNGDVYAFVLNYPTLEATIKNIDSFATVVMEYTPPDDPALHPSCAAKGRFVKFFTYVPDELGDQQRLTAINFDGRGERYTPGNCVTCHGGDVGNLSQLEQHPTTGEMLFRDCGDTNAMFLPWDLDSFLYSDTDPAIVRGAPRPNGTSFVDYTDPQGRFRRQAQEEQFRKLNAAAFSTYQTHVAEGGDPARVASVIDMVNGWYGGQLDQPNARFDGSYTPPGWDTSTEIRNVYHIAFARHCRACHVQLADTSKHFTSYDDLVLNALGNPRPLEDYLYRRGVMPLARLTMDRFWVPFEGNAVAAELLAHQLAADGYLSDPTLRPGAPVFEIIRTPNPAKERDVVRLDARASSFVRNPQWTALRGTANGVCEQPTLIAANTLEVAFRADAPGRYCLELSSGGTSTVEEFEVAANAPPQLVQRALPFTVDENAAATAIDLEYTDADDLPSSLVYTLQSALNGAVSLNGAPVTVGGQFTQADIDAGLVRFAPSLGVNLAAGAIVQGGFDYSITDGFATLGPPRGAPLTYVVNIRGVNDGQPTVTVLQGIAPASLAFDGTATIGTGLSAAGRISASDPDTDAAGLTISITVNAPAAGVVTPASLTYQQLLNGSVFTYSHHGNFPIDLSDQLQVSVSDGTFTSSPQPMAVNGRVSFASNIAGPVAMGSSGIVGGCASECHNPTGGGFGAPSFLTALGAVSHTEVSNRVTLPETACGNANAPTSLLLAKPSMVVAHTGGLRDGFDLGGNRDNYELIRTWICSFNAANN